MLEREDAVTREADFDLLRINPIRTLTMDAVQAANAGHHGPAMATDALQIVLLHGLTGSKHFFAGLERRLRSSPTNAETYSFDLPGIRREQDTREQRRCVRSREVRHRLDREALSLRTTRARRAFSVPGGPLVRQIPDIQILNLMGRNDDEIARRAIEQRNVHNVLLPGGHLMLLEHPEEPVEAIERFLSHGRSDA